MAWTCFTESDDTLPLRASVAADCCLRCKSLKVCSLGNKPCKSRCSLESPSEVCSVRDSTLVYLHRCLPGRCCLFLPLNEAPLQIAAFLFSQSEHPLKTQWARGRIPGRCPLVLVFIVLVPSVAPILWLVATVAPASAARAPSASSSMVTPAAPWRAAALLVVRVVVGVAVVERQPCLSQALGLARAMEVWRGVTTH